METDRNEIHEALKEGHEIYIITGPGEFASDGMCSLKGVVVEKGEGRWGKWINVEIVDETLYEEGDESSIGTVQQISHVSIVGERLGIGSYIHREELESDPEAKIEAELAAMRAEAEASPQTIIVNMIDSFSQQPVKREIDISNFSVPDTNAASGWECDIITHDNSLQRDILNSWIEDRANEQHNTVLELIDWEIV